ncbi:MAG: fibrillarin-like rRNA/tRNA 2'-O-methyltransferase [Candidatus Micrarchaeia archaeon]
MGSIKSTQLAGVYNADGKLATLSMSPGFRIHGEIITRDGTREYRIWDPNRSKLAAAIKKGLKNWPFAPGKSVLYLGAASGVTVSFISDIVGENGRVYAVEFSPNSMRDLLLRCEGRKNVWPILADARLPENYSFVGQVDVLFEDVAQPDQDRILIENARYLKKGGIAMIAVKSQSIDVRLKPKDVYRRVLDNLGRHFEILEKFELDPYEKHHMFIVARKK